MSHQVSLTIDGQAVTVDAGTTILDAAASVGIDIPVICYHPHLTANGLCRICSVDVTGWRTQAAACVTQVAEGMEVFAQTDSVRRGRKTLLEMLASTVNLDEAPEILDMMKEYGADTSRIDSEKKRDVPVYDDNPFYLRDYSQCINCWRCVQVCADDAQYTYALNFNGRGFDTTIATFMNDGMMDTSCVFCGQCVGACPTGALKPKRQAMLEDGEDPDSIFQATRMKRQKK